MVLIFKVGNSPPSLKKKVEERIGETIVALMEREFLGVPFQVKSTRCEKEWK